MRQKELLIKIGNNMPCLMCPAPHKVIQEKGIHDISYLMRRMAEILWGKDDRDLGECAYINNRLACIFQIMCGDKNESREKIEVVIEDISSRIQSQGDLIPVWEELKEILIEHI